MKKIFLTMIALGFLVPLRAGVAPKPAAVPPTKAPEKLSDLYKFFGYAVRDGFKAEVNIWPIKIVGRSWELIETGLFPEVELTVKPFEAQGLRFDKVELLFRHLEIEPEPIQEWKLKLKAVREVQSRIIFNLRSLRERLASQLGEIKLSADVTEQALVMVGQGRLAMVPLSFEAVFQPRWDEASKKLWLDPIRVRWAGREVPRWLWWLGSGWRWQGPVLDLSESWIPFNIQEVHVGWDRVNLSTNW